MYLGRIVESGPAESVYEQPAHPYTAALLSAIPMPDPGAWRDRLVLGGDIPDPSDPPRDCRFHPRCPFAFDPCREAEPPAFRTPSGVTVHCHLHTEGPRLAGASVREVGPTR